MTEKELPIKTATLHELLNLFRETYPEVRMEDLARLSGVATKTISTLRNNPDHIADERTDDRLRRAIWKVQETPNIVPMLKRDFYRDLEPDELSELFRHVDEIYSRRFRRD